MGRGRVYNCNKKAVNSRRFLNEAKNLLVVGTTVGKAVGSKLGTTVGTKDGTVVGTQVGTTVGLTVGITEGLTTAGAIKLKLAVIETEPS